MTWFQPSLTGRSRYVSVNGHVSTSLPLTCGVPQGCILGSSLLFIHVNDFASVSKVLTFYLFYDDISRYFESDDLLTLYKKL